MTKTLPERISELETLSTTELRARWEQAIKRSVPKRASRDLLLRTLAYHVQEQAEGGLSKVTRRRLARLAGGEADPARSPKSITPRPKPGTRLVREWRGAVHQVTVLEDGLDYRGTRYRSLSQIARAITGARWSGPLFFGVRNGSASPKETANGR